MTTMLDCIKRCAPLSEAIIDNLKPRTQGLVDYLGAELNDVTKIYLIGSGSSYNAAVTARPLMEKVTGLEVDVVLPNVFNRKSVFDKKALYIFTSQTGTSTLVKEMLIRTNEAGCKTVAICESKDTPISKLGKCFVDMGSGYEEYWYRTIGYVTSVVTLQAIGLRLGLERKVISEAEFDAYCLDAKKACANHPQIVQQAMAWYDGVGDRFKNVRSFLFYGSESLYGVAIEAALKVLETTKTYLGVGYEMEDGLHGPTLGFAKNDVVIALNNGNEDEWMAQGVCKFAKNELGMGYVVGAGTLDETDIPFTPSSKDFVAIEFAPVIEVLAYRLAGTANVPVEDADHSKNHVSSNYVEMHRG